MAANAAQRQIRRSADAKRSGMADSYVSMAIAAKKDKCPAYLNTNMPNDKKKNPPVPVQTFGRIVWHHSGIGKHIALSRRRFRVRTSVVSP